MMKDALEEEEDEDEDCEIDEQSIATTILFSRCKDLQNKLRSQRNNKLQL